MDCDLTCWTSVKKYYSVVLTQGNKTIHYFYISDSQFSSLIISGSFIPLFPPFNFINLTTHLNSKPSSHSPELTKCNCPQGYFLLIILFKSDKALGGYTYATYRLCVV